MQLNTSFQCKGMNLLYDDLTEPPELLYSSHNQMTQMSIKNPCYDFIMQLANRITILEKNSTDVTLNESNRYADMDEVPEFQHEMNRIHEMLSAFEGLRTDVKLLQH